MSSKWSAEHSFSQRDELVPIFDPYSILTVLEAGHRTLMSVADSVASAFAVAGAGWRIAQTEEMLGRALQDRNASPPQPCQDQRRFDLGEQFSCTTNVVQAAIDKSDTVRKLQAAASEKLDATEYALSRMLDELSLVMPAIERMPQTDAKPRQADVVRGEFALAA
ncbi:MAG: hypothetical protein ACR2OV_17625 [Hyphomicrobiaceae bacterium]